MQINEKERLCIKLVALDKKRINDEDIINAVDDINNETGSDLSYTAAKRAWLNFVETGGKYTDRRKTTGNGTIIMTPTVEAFYPKRTIKRKTAAKIILEYLNSNDLNSRELCNKYKISLTQFYDLLHELNVSGTIMGKEILDPKKYAKIDVKDAIWFTKYPATRRKSITSLTPFEKVALVRVSQVLDKYLRAI